MMPQPVRMNESAPSAAPMSDGADRLAPIRFIRRAGGRYIGLLGVWEVAEIAPDTVPGILRFRLSLTGCSPEWRYTGDFGFAQRRVADRVRDWIVAARITTWLRTESR